MTETTYLCQVISVFDPEGNGGDFAYTVGLHEHGVPELHIWARPSEGEDPGSDWMLSGRDRHGVLMGLAEELVAGRIGVGSERTEIYDDGLATVIYRLDEPVEADEVEAYGARPAPVIPVRWRLERPPAGEPTEIDAATAANIDERAGVEWALVPLIARRSNRVAINQWRLGWRPEPRCGPQGPVVLAVAAQLTLSDVELVATIAAAMAAAEQAGWVDGYDRALLAAHARIAGRQSVCAEARAVGDETVCRLFGKAGRPTAFLDVVLTSLGVADSQECVDWVVDAIGRYARTVLAAEALRDVIPNDLYLSATTVRDVVYADREVRPLQRKRRANPLIVSAVGARVGSLSADDVRPMEWAIEAMTDDERSHWSQALLTLTLQAARSQRALPALDDLLRGRTAGQRLRQQRRRIEKRFAVGEDVSVQCRRHRTLRSALEGLATLLSLSVDTEPAMRAALAGPIPASLLSRLGHVDIAALEASWRRIMDATMSAHPSNATKPAA